MYLEQIKHGQSEYYAYVNFEHDWYKYKDYGAGVFLQDGLKSSFEKETLEKHYCLIINRSSDHILSDDSLKSLIKRKERWAFALYGHARTSLHMSPRHTNTYSDTDSKNVVQLLQKLMGRDLLQKFSEQFMISDLHYNRKDGDRWGVRKGADPHLNNTYSLYLTLKEVNYICFYSIKTLVDWTPQALLSLMIKITACACYLVEGYRCH